MLQKLRIKFIALATGLLFLVLTIIIGIVNLLNYRHVLYSSDFTLKLLASNNGSFPDNPDTEGRPLNWKMSPELPFETRFFSVQLDSEENIVSVNFEKIAAVTPEIASGYLEQVLNSPRNKGFIGEYRYLLSDTSSGSMIVFLDCGRQLSSVRSFMLISVGISLAGLLVISLLLYVLSAPIVRPIADSYEKQRQFITNASHDLKTPLTIIDADIDILEMDYGSNEWLQDIQKQTKRLVELIRELMLLSRMEEKDAHFQMIDFPISDVVGETAQSFEALALTHGKTFTLRIQPMLSYCGDENAIRRLVTILLDNAQKYSDTNGSIALSLHKTDRLLKLSVSNSCTPITEEDRKHLFDRFYRGDKSRNSQTGGYGIGLSVAKAIVQAHKGSIRAVTADGGHSLTIAMTFPLK